MEKEYKNLVLGCQNCKKDFVIEPDDFSFYEKIKVPPPTFCPECRLQRRFLFRNERTLYKRSCDLCKDNIISMYFDKSSFPVYCNNCWYSDKWDVRQYAKELDLNDNFLEQVKNILETTPRPALIGSSNVNCGYVNYSAWLKNTYLSVGCANLEDSAYCYRSFDSKSVFDCFSIIDSELCSETSYCFKNYKTSYSEDCENSLDSMFISNCRNVSNCLGSMNLRNVKYHILNKQVDELTFKEMRNQLSFYSENIKFKYNYSKFKLTQPYKYANNISVTNSTGNYLNQTKNCKNCFVIRESENLRYCIFGSVLKDSYDINFCDNSNLIYESSNIEQNYLKLFSLTSWFSKEITYCDLCFSSSNLFGCVGVRNKQYCILNKQYTKEEYENLIPKIIKNMMDIPYIDNKGRIYRYGELFPSEFSPFAYNETMAQEYFPLTKEQAVEQGYRWRGKEEKKYTIDIKTEDIPDGINNVPDDITNKIIECIHKNCNHQCVKAFKITYEELQFYKRMNLPIPRLCPNCRHGERILQRNPLKLWHRSCMKEGCNNEFETSYSPDRPEIIYCEKCYQAEVY